MNLIPDPELISQLSATQLRNVARTLREYALRFEREAAALDAKNPKREPKEPIE